MEIQSDAGALLVSRLTTVALTALHDQGEAVNGMIAYDTDKKAFVAAFIAGRRLGSYDCSGSHDDGQ